MISRERNSGPWLGNRIFFYKGNAALHGDHLTGTVRARDLPDGDATGPRAPRESSLEERERAGAYSGQQPPYNRQVCD